MQMDNLWPGWELVRQIGTGGFGKVYEIRRADGALGEYHSALKVITIPRSQEEYQTYVDNGYDEEGITTIFKSQVNDLISEFQLMSQFRGTSHIVSYEDHKIIPRDEGRRWDILIRMELLTSLPEYYNKHKIGEKDVVKLGIDICDALELCAQRNVIHRDIKPQNIFVNEFGDYKLGDFGIAKTITHTTAGTKIGTPGYMAPEVYNREPYNATADIYSLGLVMYWMLNERRMPFQPLPPEMPNEYENEKAWKRRLSGEPFPSPRHGSRQIHTILQKACAYEPGDRYSSAKEMRHDLEQLLRFIQRRGEVFDNDDARSRKVVFCQYCGAALTGENAKCPHCGREPESRKKPKTPGVSGRRKYWPVFLAAIALCVVSAVIVIRMKEQGSAAIPPDENAVPIISHNYQVVLEDASWAEAEQKAKDAGGHLVTIGDETEWVYLLGLLTNKDYKNAYLWIGARRTPPDQEYQWIRTDSTGKDERPFESSTASLWLDGEPSYTYEDRVEDCIVLQYDENSDRWVMNDAAGDLLHYAPWCSGRIGYIIEFEKDT